MPVMVNLFFKFKIIEVESHQEEEHVVSSSIIDQLDKEVTLARQAGKKRTVPNGNRALLSGRKHRPE